MAASNETLYANRCDEVAVVDRIVNEGGFDELRKRLTEALRHHVSCNEESNKA